MENLASDRNGHSIKKDLEGIEHCAGRAFLLFKRSQPAAAPTGVHVLMQELPQVAIFCSKKAPHSRGFFMSIRISCL